MEIDCEDTKPKCDAVWLGIARNSFNKLKNAYGAGTYYARDIDDELRKAHATYKDLYTTGNHTDAEVKADIDGLVQTGLIRGARIYFDELRTTGIPDIKADDIRNYLSRANVGYDVLDASGKRTDDEMRAEVWARVKARQLEMAREHFAELRKSGIPDTKVDLIESDLRDAGAGYDALDPTGRKSAAEMRAEVKRRYLEARLGAPLSSVSPAAPNGTHKPGIVDRVRSFLGGLR